MNALRPVTHPTPAMARTHMNWPKCTTKLDSYRFLYPRERKNPPHDIHPPCATWSACQAIGDPAIILSVSHLDRFPRSTARWPAQGGVVLTWRAGQASALDSREIGAGREVGNVRVTDTQGRPAVHDIPFAFAFHAFHPDGQWMLEE